MCNMLNLFAISQISFISFWPSLKKIANCFLGRVLDNDFICGFHVFLTGLVPNISLISTKNRVIVHLFR